MKKMFTALFLLYVLSVSAYAETVQFDKDSSITIDIPAKWETEQLRGTLLPDMETTFDLKLTSPLSEKAALTVTTGKSQTGKPLTKKQLDALTKIITTRYLQRAVEKKAAFIELPVSGGQGKYAIFTNRLLVNRTPGPDEYKYIVLFLINYDNGCFVYATGFANDISGAGFQNMITSISSIEPSFAATIPTPPVQIKKNKQGILIGNAESRVKLLIPPGNLKAVKERIGGRQNSPGYFAFIDEKTNLVLSGWLEPVEKIKRKDAKEALDDAKALGVEMLNPESAQVGDWEVLLYDQPVPKMLGNSVHIHANLLKEDAWFNLHISITTRKSSEVLRDELIEYLKTIQIIE
jgi:hypothetical protein